jgi:Tol biopolymer transport system component
MFMEVANNRWTPPAPVPFQKGAFRKCDSPCWSADGSKLYFISLLLAGDSGIETLCYVETMENAWSEPALFDSVINSGNLHWQFSFADNGNLYFSSERENGFGGYDLYRSDCTNGVYSEPENLGPTVNTAESDATPFIAHDESCLIFASTGRDDGLGRSDLYVSFLMEDSTWTEPRNLGPRINTVHHEICPVVTPDGKYLFFLRSQSVYWIDASVIGELKPEN